MSLRPYNGNSFSFIFFKYTRYHILLNWKAGLFYLPPFWCVLQVIFKLRLFFHPRMIISTLVKFYRLRLIFFFFRHKQEWRDLKFLSYFFMHSFTRRDAQSNQNWFTCSLPSSHKSSSSRWGSPSGQLSVAIACFKQVSGVFFHYWSSTNYKSTFSKLQKAIL